MLKLHHLFVLSGRANGRWMYSTTCGWWTEGLPPARKTWNKCHRWEFGVHVWKYLHQWVIMATEPRNPFNGRFIWKKCFFVASCARSWNQGILKVFFPCSSRYAVIHLQYLIWALNIWFCSRNSSFSWTTSLFFLHVCIQNYPIWFTPAASFIGSFQNRSTCKRLPGLKPRCFSVKAQVHHRLWTNERRSERYWCTFTDDGMLSETWMEKQDLYPACCGCGGGCCWRPRYQILPQLKLMLKER